MKRVTGLGGIFFKSKDPEKSREWYHKHLGLTIDEHGSIFEWRNTDAPDQRAYTVWSPFAKDTTYFAPSGKEFMVNYRVENLEKLLEALRQEGVEVVGEMEEFDYGKFAWILDLEGHKIELWEPKDVVFTDHYKGKTTH